MMDPSGLRPPPFIREAFSLSYRERVRVRVVPLMKGESKGDYSQNPFDDNTMERQALNLAGRL